jgi:Tol biopolymer transport system component
LTQWGFNEPGVLSPDGGRIAYNSLAQVVVEGYARGAARTGGALPSNIWVIDSFGGSGLRVTEQPSDAAFFSEGLADKGIIRVTPAWSPDGARLAYAEQTYPERLGSVLLYDFASGVTFTLASGLPPTALPPDVLWGSSGILVRNAQNGSDVYTSYAPDGRVQTTFIAGGNGRTPIFHALMQASGREMLGVLFNDGGWELYDPLSGGSQPANGLPEMYSLRAEQTSLALSPIINDQGGFTWRLLTPDGTQLTEFVSAPYFVPQRYALSPSGQAVAFSEYREDQRIFADTINVWQNGTVTVIPNAVDFPLVGGLLWGTTGWRVRVGVG